VSTEPNAGTDFDGALTEGLERRRSLIESVPQPMDAPWVEKLV
jgi:hypothetical protein